MASLSVVQDTQVLQRQQERAIEEHLDEILSAYQGKKEELVPILQQVQQAFGYVPEPAMKRIAKFLKLLESTVFGVGTFYAQFKLVPSGRNIIRVCCGTACHVRGSAEILGEMGKQLGISAGETTPDLEYSLETIACFGSCALAPVVVTNDKVHGRMTAPKAREILNKGAQ
jgi:NADH:ubiquinone oxidoreductase subunit E